MKNKILNNSLNYLFLLLFLFSLSCGDSKNDIIDEPENITDDYKLVAVSDQGEVFEIGNNTGNVNNVGQINKENSNSILATPNFIASNNKIYVIEYTYNPSPTNNLIIFDRQNKTSQIIPLVLPETINGDERAIIGLTMDSTNNLIGILAENILANNSTKHLININLQDHSVSPVGITFTEDSVSSMVKMGSVLYISTWREGFLEVDLTHHTVNNLSTIQGSRLAQINTSELAIMQPVTGSIGGAKPGVLDLTTKSILDGSNGETFGLVTAFGNSIYKNNVYLNLVSSNSRNLYFGILKSNFKTNENSIVKINSNSMNRNVIILDTTK